jgi:aerotaxis receptor
MKKNFPVTGVEKSYSDDCNILSTTNLKGSITYINKDFIDISGFTEDELLNKNHNVVRHPDMPPAAFEDLWNNIKAGRSWKGIVKNRCKNGDHYWVDAYATPIRENGQIVEYQSVRSKPAREDVDRAEKLYKQLNEGKVPAGLKDSALSLPIKVTLGVTAAVVIATLIASFATGMGLTSAIATAVLAAVLSGGVIFTLLSPLSKAVKMAHAVDGNPITRFVYTGRNDEIGTILSALQMLQSETGGVVGRISDSSKQVSESAAVLSETMQTTVQGVQQQYSETDQVATAMN